MKTEMKKLVLILITLVLIAAAPPMLPSSFWGYTDAPVGSSVTASIDGVVRAETQMQLYNGAAVYALNVPGTYTDQNKQVTLLVDGEPIALVPWQSGTNHQVDLYLGYVSQPEFPYAEPEVSPAPDVPEGRPYVEPPRPFEPEG